MFQNFGMSFGKKKFLTKKLFKVPVSQRDPKGRNSPLHVIRERGLSLFGSHGKGARAKVSHCDSTNRGQKFSKSKNFSTFFKTGFLHVSRLWDEFWQKKKIFDEKIV